MREITKIPRVEDRNEALGDEEQIRMQKDVRSIGARNPERLANAGGRCWKDT